MPMKTLSPQLPIKDIMLTEKFYIYKALAAAAKFMSKSLDKKAPTALTLNMYLWLLLLYGFMYNHKYGRGYARRS